MQTYSRGRISLWAARPSDMTYTNRKSIALHEKCAKKFLGRRLYRALERPKFRKETKIRIVFFKIGLFFIKIGL